MNWRKFLEPIIKEKIGKVSMIIGALVVLWPMYLYTGVALMAETEPIINVVIFLLVGCLAGPLTILSIILSFFKKIAKIGFIGSIFFSFPFLIVGIYTMFQGINFQSGFATFLELSFIEIVYIVGVYLSLLLSSMLIISGILLRIVLRREVIIASYGILGTVIGIVVLVLVISLGSFLL